MKLLYERDEIRSVAKRWRSQYGRTNDPKKKSIQSRLDRMDAETATREDVAKIIGNDSWIDTRCDECGTYQTTLVHIGDEPDYDARWQVLCAGCIGEAIKLLGSAA